MAPSAPGGRASAEDSKSARTRARILDAAAQVLARRGYAGTRLAEIAEIAAVQAPALYYYFSSRDELVEQVVLSGQRAILDHVAGVLDALPAGMAPLDRIDRAVAAHLEVVLSHSAFSSAALRNGGQLPEPVRRHLVEGQRSYLEAWRELIEAAADAGELAAGLDPGLARMFVLGALNWAPQWFDPDRGPLETLVSTMQRFVRHGLTRGAPALSTGGAPVRAPAP